MTLSLFDVLPLISKMKTVYEKGEDKLILSFGVKFKPEEVYKESSYAKQGILILRLKKNNKIVWVEVPKMHEVMEDPDIKEKMGLIPKPLLDMFIKKAVIKD